MTMLLRTTAPFSTVTPRKRTLFSTEPLMTQPAETSELATRAPSRYFAGA